MADTQKPNKVEQQAKPEQSSWVSKVAQAAKGLSKNVKEGLQAMDNNYPLHSDRHTVIDTRDQSQPKPKPALDENRKSHVEKLQQARGEKTQDISQKK